MGLNLKEEPPEILSEKIYSSNGSFRVVERYLRGKHPKLGSLVPPGMTWSGCWETRVMGSVVSPIREIRIEE